MTYDELYEAIPYDFSSFESEKDLADYIYQKLGLKDQHWELVVGGRKQVSRLIVPGGWLYKVDTLAHDNWIIVSSVVFVKETE